MKIDEFIENARNHVEFYYGHSGDIGMLSSKLGESISIIERQRNALNNINESLHEDMSEGRVAMNIARKALDMEV